MNYDPKAFYEALPPEKRAEYDQLTKRINELERTIQATPSPPNTTLPKVP